MAHQNELLAFLLDQLAALGKVRARAMFGGFGIYRGDTIFAIVVDERLYLKTDDDSRPAFVAQGLGPFTYTSRGRTLRLSYYEAPAEVFEDPDCMSEWARRALAASARANLLKSRKKKAAARRRSPRRRR